VEVGVKTPKELDVVRKAEWFSDTPDVVTAMELGGYTTWARHLHKMFIYHKALIAEIRKLRRELKGGKHE
jgi:hypothetical protein